MPLKSKVIQFHPKIVSVSITVSVNDKKALSIFKLTRRQAYLLLSTCYIILRAINKILYKTKEMFLYLTSSDLYWKLFYQICFFLLVGIGFSVKQLGVLKSRAKIKSGQFSNILLKRKNSIIRRDHWKIDTLITPQRRTVASSCSQCDNIHWNTSPE